MSSSITPSGIPIGYPLISETAQKSAPSSAHSLAFRMSTDKLTSSNAVLSKSPVVFGNYLAPQDHQGGCQELKEHLEELETNVTGTTSSPETHSITTSSTTTPPPPSWSPQPPGDNSQTTITPSLWVPAPPSSHSSKSSPPRPSSHSWSAEDTPPPPPPPQLTSATWSAEPPSSPALPPTSFSRELTTSLSHHGIIPLKGLIGLGGCGEVYAVNYQGNTTDYVFKKENKPCLLTRRDLDSRSGYKFWRHSGDIAAARLQDIPNMVEPKFFILQVHKDPKSLHLEFCYVPADHIKEFGKELLEKYPKANVYLHSQVMTRASGEDLDKLIDTETINSHPLQKDFKNVLYGLYSFVAAAHARNFAHRDLKTQNLIFDQPSGKLTVIDTGFGQHLARRGKSGPPKGISNPTTSARMVGTQHYRSPRVFNKESYGSEVDCHSFAIILLELLNVNDFSIYADHTTLDGTNTQKKETVADFFGKDPKQYLKKYLMLLGPSSPTAQLLQQSPPLKNLIDLLFQASAAGAEGEAAFAQLKDNPYLAGIIAEKTA